MVLQATDGLDMTEGSTISLKNVQLITKNTNPVINIHNSKDIVLEKIGYKNNAELLLNVTGEKTKGLVLKNIDASKAKKKVEFGFGAGEKSLSLK
jgi:hypothetical protein